ncbi:hypothetical protein [Raoultibacter timonensis]|uniref:hypothetical protein n=1 Tax=Raoultibacter timonensis TaxID=1907662 RepID=UPI0026DC048D|nr:hypothetical protein [Raoultibacter timonensis]
MEIDEGMIVTVEELGMKFVVIDIVGDYVIGSDDCRIYTRIDDMRLIPLRMRDECEKELASLDAIEGILDDAEAR